MKNGTVSTKPTMSSRPPSMPIRSVEDSLSDLQLVQTITEAPARVAAAVLLEQMPEVQGANQPTPEPVVAKAKATKGDDRVQMPWDLVEDKGVISFNFKLPTKLATKLKFLGETTYGQSMTSIVADAVKARVEKMLKERKLD